MATASSPYLMGQSSLNASHDVFMVRTMLFDPSSYWSEVHSFSSDLDHERTCREKLALRSTSERVGSIVRPGQLATVDDALGEMLSADPYRPSRHDRLPTREGVHRGDIVALHRVQRSIRSCLRAAMSGGHHGLVYV